MKLRSHGVEEGRQISTSFSAYGSELFDVAGDMLDGISIWNKFDPVYQGKDWQKLLQDYRIARHGTEQVSNPVADYYDSVMAICQCYEEFGITSVKGIQSAYRWQEGQKVTDYQFFVFDGKTPVNRSSR